MSAVEGLNIERFDQPLIILATADEETSMDGARTLAELGRPKARAAVIGEPTGLVPVMAHKGMMMDEIRLLGKVDIHQIQILESMPWKPCMP